MFQKITFLGGFLPKSLLLLLSSFLILRFSCHFRRRVRSHVRASRVKGRACQALPAVLRGVRASRVKGRACQLC